MHVAKTVEHPHDKPRARFRIPASVRFFSLFRCVHSFLLTRRSEGRSNFDKGLPNLITLIQKRHKNCIYIKTIYKNLVNRGHL